MVEHKDALDTSYYPGIGMHPAYPVVNDRWGATGVATLSFHFI